jgi:hypothetical protein
MSRKKFSKVKDFLEQDGYLLVFTLICLVSLATYFLASKYLVGDGKEVLDTTSVKGVWVSVDNSNGYIDQSYFNEYDEVNTQRLTMDDNGKIIFSNSDLFINGSFDTKEVLDTEMWDIAYIGDFTLKINERNWVFKDLVWKEGSSEYVLGVTKIDNGYLISFFPSVSLNILQKQLWVFEYSGSDDSVKQVFFKNSQGSTVFIDSTYLSVLKKDGDYFLRVDFVDPSLVGGREVLLYKYTSNSLDFLKSYILKAD